MSKPKTTAIAKTARVKLLVAMGLRSLLYNALISPRRASDHAETITIVNLLYGPEIRTGSWIYCALGLILFFL